MPSVSAAQHRAMEAAAHGNSTLGIPKKVGKEFVAADAAMLPIGAGTVFVSPEGKVLLLKRAGVEGVDNYVGHWALPGGKGDEGETAEQAADRENREELGDVDQGHDGKSKLIDRVETPNGMMFHTFAQPVIREFTPKLNEEHSEFGWFSPGELPEQIHPSVKRVLSENLGVAEDMKPEDWDALRDNFAKWTREEEAEPEHKKGPRHHHDLTPADDYAEDDQPQLATAGNTGTPIGGVIKKLNRKKIAADALCTCMGKGCEKCGNSGRAFVTDTRKKQPVIPGSMATPAMRSKSVGRAFDMALFMRNIAMDAEFNEGDHPRADNGQFGAGSGGSSSKGKSGGAKSKEAKAPIKMSALEKKGGKLGSNEGGVYEGSAGEKYYIKKPATKAHVTNERQAAALYQLAGAKTLDYLDVEGGDHVATEWQKLEKKNISEFTPAERKEAAKDFAIHAWLSNWDAAGLGGDNQGVLNGKTTTLDVGGSLRFRAQGGPKGGAFGDKVTEFDTLRDKGMNPDAARLFAPMSEAELKSSIERVTAIPDAKIRDLLGADKELADRLIARKKNLASRVGLAMDALHPAIAAWNRRAMERFAQDEATFVEEDHPRADNGQFGVGSGGGAGAGEKSGETKRTSVPSVPVKKTTSGVPIVAAPAAPRKKVPLIHVDMPGATEPPAGRQWTATLKSQELYQTSMREEPTDAEVESLTAYANNGYKKVNSGLRKFGSLMSLSKDVRNLDSLIAKADLPEPVQVYRGVGKTLSSEIVKRWDQTGGKDVVFSDRAFVSSSRSRIVAGQFSPYVMEFVLPKGTKALSVPAGTEEEMLLERGRKFRVRNISGNTITAELLP